MSDPIITHVSCQIHGCQLLRDRDEEVLNLLREVYRCVPENRLGTSKCVDYDPAGSTYEFNEHEWSRRVRELLGIKYEPTGI